MAVGWARDGAVQEQIDATIEDGVEQARRRLPEGESLTECEQCGGRHPRTAAQGRARRTALRRLPVGGRKGAVGPRSPCTTAAAARTASSSDHAPGERALRAASADGPSTGSEPRPAALTGAGY